MNPIKDKCQFCHYFDCISKTIREMKCKRCKIFHNIHNLKNRFRNRWEAHRDITELLKSERVKVLREVASLYQDEQDVMTLDDIKSHIDGFSEAVKGGKNVVR